MAMAPSISGTAQRRINPSAGLKVDGVGPAAFGAAIGAGLQQVGDAGQEVAGSIQQFDLAKQAEENRLANFDRQTKFIDFGSAQATRLEDMSRDLSGPAKGFTEGFMAGFDADASDFLERIPERDKPAWRAKFAGLRSQVSAGALKTEFGQRDAYYNATTNDTLGKLKNGAMSSPGALAAYRDQGEQIIEASGLPAEAKLEKKLAWRGDVAVAAGMGDVQTDPYGAIKRLGGIEPPNVAGGAAGYVSATGAAATVAGVLRGAGRSENVIAGILGNIQQESGFAHQGPNGDGGKAAGLAQWHPDRQALFKKVIGVDVKNATLEQQAQFINYELDHPQQAGMTVGQRDAILNAKSPEEAARLFDKHYERSDGKSRAKREAAARSFAGPPLVTDAPSGSTAPDTPPAVDARYADLPAEARAQLIGAAQREINRREQQTAAVAQEEHSTWLNGFLTELHDGKAGSADIAAARKQGRLTDIDEINRAEGIVAERDKASADITNYNAMVADPNFVWNPYDKTQKAGVEAAVKAQGGTPQAALQVWQRTGILADSGAVALRGGLVSTNPQQVQAVANIAGNMVRRNPNAFAGVTGGEDMEKSAFAFNHYVYDLGYSPQDASKRVAQENTPEFKSKVKIGQPELAAYKMQLRRSGADDAAKALGGRFATGPQTQEANSAYAELVVDSMNSGHDLGTAKAVAVSQMRKLYGVSQGGVIRKYAPELRYPVIGGSHQYVYDDAKATVETETGRSPLAVRLIPIPGITDQDFRTGAAPRYRVMYGYKGADGQEVWDVVNGQFAADTRAAAVATSRARQAQFSGARTDAAAAQRSTRAKQMDPTLRPGATGAR